MFSTIERAFKSWIEHQDETLLREAASLRSWLATSTFVCFFLPVLAYVPGPRDYFGLRFLPALLCYIPAAVTGIPFALMHRPNQPFSRRDWVWILVNSSSLQFFAASLIVWSSPRGAAAIASLFIFTAAYQGHVLRTTLAEPFLTLGTTVSVAAVALLNQSRDRLGLLLFAAVAAISIELVLGTSARRWALSQRRNEQLRVALTANILDEQAREMKRLSETLVDVLGHNHDMNNTLMALRLSADALVMETGQRRIDGMGQILNDLRSGIDRLTHMAGDIKIAGRPADAPAPEVVDVVKVIEGLLPTVGARFPRVKHVLAADRAGALRCAVPGGVVTIRRIVENLLINACEGDGHRSAGRVDIKVARDPSGGRLMMVFTDDGPGFSAEQLTRGVELFASTKPQGSGLGLYTCERLVRASDGQLQRANAPGGGAQLTVILPVVRS